MFCMHLCMCITCVFCLLRQQQGTGSQRIASHYANTESSLRTKGLLPTEYLSIPKVTSLTQVKRALYPNVFWLSRYIFHLLAIFQQQNISKLYLDISVKSYLLFTFKFVFFWASLFLEHVFPLIQTLYYLTYTGHVWGRMCAYMCTCPHVCVCWNNLKDTYFMPWVLTYVWHIRTYNKYLLINWWISGLLNVIPRSHLWLYKA